MDEKLKKMPEKVYATLAGDGATWLGTLKEAMPDATEYIRADLAKSPSPQLREVRERLERRLKELDEIHVKSRNMFDEQREQEVRWFLKLLKEVDRAG